MGARGTERLLGAGWLTRCVYFWKTGRWLGRDGQPSSLQVQQDWRWRTSGRGWEWDNAMDGTIEIQREDTADRDEG